MILNFDKECEELKKILGHDLPGDFDFVMVLLKLYLRGRSEGIEHAVRIVQQRAINPMPIVAEIRKPVR